MTIKQLLIGTLLGATAFSSMLHRLPKQPVHSAKQEVKVAVKATVKRTPHLSRAHRKHTTETRLSLNKVFD